MNRYQNTIKLSVVIPTRNRASLLNKALESIMRQTLADNLFEIIVVDNGSSDDTKVICDQYAKKINNFMYIFESSPGLHVGRNSGFRLANGEFIVYADDDIMAFPDWLKSIYTSFITLDDVVLIGGNNYPCYESKPPDWVLSLWKKNSYGQVLPQFSLVDFGEKGKYISPKYIWGCNFAIRKELLISFGGFHPDGMPNEYLMFRGDGESYIAEKIIEKGLKAYFHPGASIQHFVPNSRMTREYLQKRSYMQGISDSYADIRRRGYILYSHLLPLKIKRLDEKYAISNKDVLQCCNYDYHNGYFEHHSQAYNNPVLLEWILRENYIGEYGSLATA